MKKLALEIGTAALLTAAAAAPAMAQVGFYAGPFGVGVEVGAPAYYKTAATTATRAATMTTTAALTSSSAAAGAAAVGTVDGMVVMPTSITASRTSISSVDRRD